MASVRPFKFENLPRLSKQDVALRASLTTYLSYRPFEPDFVAGLAQAVGEMLKVPLLVADQTLSDAAGEMLETLLPSIPCVAILGTSIDNTKILVDMDPSLATMAIEMLLGGPAQPTRFARALTQIEVGVLSYLLLRVITHFHNGWDSGREMGLTLDRVATSFAEVRTYAPAETDFQTLNIRLALGPRTGYVKIFLPNNLITEHFGRLTAQSGATPQELDYMRRRLPSIADKQVTLRLTAAHLELSPDDIANIEGGDIILLENHGLQKSAAGIEGTVFVTLGFGKNGGFKGRLRIDGEQVKLEVVEIVTQEQPLEASMPEDHDNDEDTGADNLPETEGLLRDVDASIAVELGRLRMNAAQVVRLRSGQVLRLARGPLDPVDLVVNGKLFARGELVEIDGEMGVRLIQVTGAE